MRDQRIDRLYQRFQRTGDPAALGEVFDATAGELAAVARHLCRDATEAEDVLQATFLVAIENREDWDSSRPFRPWILGVLARRSRRARESARRTPDPERLLERVSQDPEADARTAELGEAVRRGIDSLPETYAAVVRPYLEEGRSATEVGLELGITANAAYVRLHRGLARLRAALPAGLAGVVAASLGPQTLARLRESLLAAARRSSPMTAPAGAGLTLGLTKEWVLGFAAFTLMGGVAWWALDGSHASPSPPAIEVEAERTAVTATFPSGVQGLPEPRRELRDGSELKQYAGRVVDAVNGLPLERASVRTGRQGEFALATTDQDGHFAFQAETAVENSLYVEAKGYAPFRAPLDPVARGLAYDNLGRNEHGAEIDLGRIALARGARVRGRVVHAGDRAPAAGARLYLLAQAPPGKGSLIALSDHVLARSDEDGSFELRGRVPYLDQGDYTLYAVTPVASGRVTLSVLEGRDLVDEVVIALSPSGALTVRVTDPAGEPVADVRLAAAPMWGLLSSFWPPTGTSLLPTPAGLSAPFLVKTDDAGLARFSALPLDPTSEYSAFKVWADSESHAIPDGAAFMTQGQEGRLELSGPAWSAIALSGTVSNVDGEPLPGAELSLGDEHLATSDAQGSWSAVGIPQDALPETLSCRARGLAFARKHVRLPRAPGRIEGLDFVLEAPAPIQGRVTDSTGLAVVGVTVMINRRDRKPQETTSDDDGGFRFPDATAGTWSIEADPRTAPERFQGRVVRQVEGGATDVRLVLDRSDRPLGQVTVTVLDGRSGGPLDPAIVFLAPMNTELHEWVTSGGQLDSVERLLALGDRRASGRGGRRPIVRRTTGRVVAGPLDKGAWVITVGNRGLGLSSTSFEITEGAREVELTLTVESPGGVAGILDPGESAATGDVTVEVAHAWAGTAKSLDASSVGRATVGVTGDFEVDALIPGPYKLTLTGDGLHVPPRLVHVRSGETTEVRLAAEPSARLTLIAAAPIREGFVHFFYARGDGEWEWFDFSEERDPQVARTTVSLPPGALRWRVDFSRDVLNLRPDLIAERQDGSVELVAGEETVVTVPLVLLPSDGRH